MPVYDYKAIDREGQTVRGSLEGANEVDLEMRLKRMGLDLVTYREVERGSGAIAHGRVTRRDLITFCLDMEQLTRSGVPLLDGLRDLRDSIENPRFREVLASMIEDMEGGRMLSQALAAHPEVFDSVFANLVRAGEQAGRLTEVFANLGATLKWQDELAAQTRRLMMYPVMVLVVVLLVFTFMLMYLVPQVTSLLKTMNIPLPAQTRALIFGSTLLVDYWPVVFGLPVAAAVAGMLAVQRSQRARYLWDYAKLRLPVVGPVLQKIILSRFANFFALMYQSGITILDALQASAGIVGNRVIGNGLLRAREQVSAGDGLTETFRNLGIFPPLVIRMLRVGENTGALDTALMNIVYFYNRDVKESVDKGLAMLGPTLTLALGGLLALVMWAVLGPVYDILGKLRF